jgi:glyoxylase I family protein
MFRRSLLSLFAAATMAAFTPVTTHAQETAVPETPTLSESTIIKGPLNASLAYYVSDIARTEAFYRDVLGITLSRMEGAEPFWLNGQIGAINVVFFEMPDAKVGSTPALIFDLAEGGIDDMVAELTKKGVTIVTPVSEAPGGWSADFTDPDGFGLGFYQAETKPRSSKK